MLNTALMREPINWFTVVMMVLIAGFAAHLIVSHYQDISEAPAKSSVQ
jgi:hypothetical protein